MYTDIPYHLTNTITATDAEKLKRVEVAQYIQGNENNLAKVPSSDETYYTMVEAINRHICPLGLSKSPGEPYD